MSGPIKSSAIPHLARLLQAKRQLRKEISQIRSIHASSQTGFLSLTRSPPHTHTPRRHASTKVPSPTRIPKARPVPSSIAPPPAPTPSQSRGPKPMIWASSLFGFSVAMYLSYLYTTYRRSIRATAEIDLPQNSDVSHRWSDLSRDYDDEVALSEKLMLLRAKRARLVNEAYGNVLEVSVGTGRNMDLYDLRPYDEGENEKTGRSRRRIIRSLTFNDQSEVMVAQAERKFEEMEENRPKIARFRGRVEFVVGDAGVKGVVTRPEGGFDTIVQTMGVCSMVDPVGFLRQLASLCRQPGEGGNAAAGADADGNKDDGMGGKILLLEHGKGHYEWLNQFLDNGAKMHAIHYGCWFNKDIQQVLEESGLVVERIQRYHFGTTWEIVLRPIQKKAV